jgi:hypothetical protein
MAWEELRSGGRNWKGVRQKWRRIHRTELRSSEGPPHLLYRQTLSLDPIASHFLKKLPPPALRGFYFFLNFWTWPLFWHVNFQKWSEPGVFYTFWLGNVVRACSRHNGVRFFDISTSKICPALGCFVHFENALRALQRALFRHLNFQKWSDVGVLCTFWLGNVLRATTACNFSSLIQPTFRPSGATNHWKNRALRDFPTFSPTFFGDFLFLIFFLLLFSSLLWLFPSLLFICSYCRKFDF